MTMDAEPLLKTLDWSTYEKAVVLSPHLDDAPLSCCGLISRLHDHVDCQVVTICAGNPAPAPTFSRSREDTRELLDETDPESEYTRERRDEDIDAMERLGANFVHLGFEDAIYRRSPTSGERIYHSSREKWVSPRIDDARHIEELFLVLRQFCSNMGRVLLVSPMSIGYHMDHAITAHVAMRLEDESVDLLFYEDFPYVLDPPSIGKGLEDSPESALERMSRVPEGRYFVPVDVDHKAVVLDEYETQIPQLFGGLDDVRQALRDNELEGEPVEYFWTAKRRNTASG